MINSSVFKKLAIVAYLLICLKGSMIGFPLGLYLIFILFDFTTIAPLFAIIAILGFVLLFKISYDRKSKITISQEILAFTMLLSPILYRFAEVPLYLFNYWMFTLPLASFVILYIASLIFSCKELRFKTY